jgi:hypothetical protein
MYPDVPIVRRPQAGEESLTTGRASSWAGFLTYPPEK